MSTGVSIGRAILRWFVAEQRDGSAVPAAFISGTHGGSETVSGTADGLDWWRIVPFIALLTMGEGWHNNHHRYAGSARQGFYWWQMDASYYLLRLLAAFGLVWDLKEVPSPVLEEGRR